MVYDGVPLEGVEVTLGDGSFGSRGEILVRGPMLVRAYRDGHDPKLAGGWLPTGDGGSIDRDGRLVVHGRMSEVIVTGAEKVWPVVVEHVLAGHPEVAEVAVWKRPDPEWGERVVAWVVPVDPFAPPAGDELPRAGGRPGGTVGGAQGGRGGLRAAQDTEREDPPGRPDVN